MINLPCHVIGQLETIGHKNPYRTNLKNINMNSIDIIPRNKKFFFILIKRVFSA